MTKTVALKNLVDRFERDLTNYISSSSTYQETEIRVEYIDPFFELLGWDMSNKNGLKKSIRDVLREESQKVESSTKKPDYTFRVSALRKFFVEAKRPSVDIRSSAESSLQVRRYGFTAGLPVSILTNFRTFRVYDTRLEPKASDSPDVGLIISFEYDEYLEKFSILEKIFSRENVSLGSIENEFSVSPTGQIPANELFLERINIWRVKLAQDLYARYPNLELSELSDISQKVINRIIFIRMCEDRGIEGEETLRKAIQSKNYIEIKTLFKRLDDRYNTGLFDVDKDRLQDKYELDTGVFSNIVDEVYAPHSPYSFSILDAEFLGQVYEYFLAKQLYINEETSAIELKDKPAYEHREVIATPQPLVSEVARRAIERRVKKVSKLTMDALSKIKVFDIAVGSGRFLLSAFDQLVENAIEIKKADGEAGLYKVSENDYKLDFKVKADLMKNSLFGVDIDYNAVEVARFSLMTKLLEDERLETLPLGRKILPNLDVNIVHGNTVVDSDFRSNDQSVVIQTCPLDKVKAGLPQSFDIVVGNPPYVKTEEMLNENSEEFNYFKSKYSMAYKQFDKYFIFMEVALGLLSSDGVIGLIIPNKWMTIESGKIIRKSLASKGLVKEIVNFGSEQIFEGKSIYVCLLILDNHKNNSVFISSPTYVEFLSKPQELGFSIPTSLLELMGGNSWVLPSNNSEAKILSKISKNTIPLSEIASVKNGIQTSANDVFLIEDYTEIGDFVEFKHDETIWQIEKEITKPYINDSSKVISYNLVKSDALMIFPYTLSSNGMPKIIELAVLKRDYPKAFKYFEANKTRLSKRSVSPPSINGVYYAYGRHQALEAVFTTPKIVYSVNQKGNKYAYDIEGAAYASGGTAGEVAIFNSKNGYKLEFILALLNQRPIEFFSRKRGSPFRGGFFARGSSVVSEIPVPNLDLVSNKEHIKIHSSVVSTVQDLISINEEIKNSSGRKLENLLNNKRDKVLLIESIFCKLWGLDINPADIQLPSE